MVRAFISCICVALLSGCATTAKQTEAYLKAPLAGLPRSVKIDNVSFINQSANHCGPATLAMATSWAGRPISVEELTKQVYTPGANGTYQADMISAARRNGFLAIPSKGLPALITELSAGHPVIVFENLQFNWYPKWHYALAFGYDLDSEDIILHSGPVKEKHWDLRKFERSWMLGDYWSLIVLPAGQLAVSADDLAHATAASALEQVGHANEAKLVYESILVKWPESLPALIGLANFAFSSGDVLGACRYLETATEAHPTSAAAWHNLAIAEGEANQRKQAKVSAARAYDLAPEDSKAAYRTSLKDFL